MSIHLQTLKCAECGSHALKAQDINRYVCEHCGTVAIAEDNVTERLDRVLETVKREAARRIAEEKAAHEEEEAGVFGWVVLGLIGVGLVALGGWLFSGSSKPKAPDAQTIAKATQQARAIPQGLNLTDARQVVVGHGSSMDTALLVMLRNETDGAVRNMRIKASFHDGNTRLRDVYATPSIDMLQAGESMPILIERPYGAATNTRHELLIADAARSSSSSTGEALRFEKVRLVEQDGSLRLAGRLRNPLKERIAGFEVLVVVYDEAGAVTGYGSSSRSSTPLAPGEAHNVEARITRFGKAKVRTWDYRIAYSLPVDEHHTAPVVAGKRIVRAESAPEVLSGDLKQSVDDLLMDEGAGFDMAQLELLPFWTGRDMTQDTVYMTELVNRSSDMIAVSPAARVTLFDGHREVGANIVGRGVTHLYPGERLPVRLEPPSLHRITQTRVEWKPIRKTGLPGSRTPLEVNIKSTQAKTGTIEINFSRVHKYRHVIVRGTVSNPGTDLVRKSRLWVSLRDRENRLSGFESKDLPPLPPGESVPFELDVEQWGRDFESVSTMYQTE